MPPLSHAYRQPGRSSMTAEKMIAIAAKMVPRTIIVPKQRFVI
jgi:hypothetical protein